MIMTQVQPHRKEAVRYFRLLWIRNQAKEIIFYILFIFILTVNTRFLDQKRTDLFTYAPSPRQGDMIKTVITCMYGGGGVTRVQERNLEIMNLGAHIGAIVQVSLFPPERRTETFALSYKQIFSEERRERSQGCYNPLECEQIAPG